LWSPDGRELFYLNLGNQLMATPVENGESFAPGTATTLLEKTYFVGPNGRPYDITPDGQRFLMIQNPEPNEGAPGPTPLTLVLNWFEELKERVPPR
jgi:hypothetical protein